MTIPHTAYLAYSYASFLPWLAPTVIVLACVALVGLALGRRDAAGARVTLVSAAVGVLAMLATQSPDVKYVFATDDRLSAQLARHLQRELLLRSRRRRADAAQSLYSCSAD
jgi:hypothetical protein